MNKQELIQAVAEKADISKALATDCVEAVMSAIQDALATGEGVTLVGFGAFSTVERAERAGRNPQTGEPIQIEASRSIKFKPGKGLKDALN